MARRLTILVLLLASCSSGGGQALSTTTTSTRAPATSTTTTTTAPAPTTTTSTRLPAGPDGGEVKALVTRSGVVVTVLGRAEAGWRVSTPCGTEAIVQGGTPIHGATVVLDPGHGGKETGSTGSNGLVERDLNLSVATLTKAALEREGATVVLTRTRDYQMTLAARSALAQRLKPPVFISIHHNGGADGPSDKPGTEMYYQRSYPASKRLAGLVYEEVFKVFVGRPGIDWHANVDAGAKVRVGGKGDDYYGVLRGTNGVTGIISEALFLSASRTEADLLARPDVQAAEAAAITRAIRRFMLSDDPGSGFVTPITRTAPAGGGGGAAGCVETPLG